MKRSAISHSPQAILFGLPLKTKAVFFRQLATMINSGLPVGRAVSTSAEAGMARLGEQMTNEIEAGNSLAETMERYPYHFDRYEVALVKAGESAGQLDIQLKEIASSVESTWSLTQQIASRLIYPFLVVHGAIFLPPLFLIVKDGIEAYLRFTLSIFFPMHLFLAGCFLAYRYFRVLGGPRRLMDHTISLIPVLGSPYKLLARIRFLDALGNLIEAGFLPNQAVPLAADSCGNFWLRDAVMEAWNVEGRESAISDIMYKSRAFSPMEIGLIVSGEEAGQFSRTLKKAAESLKPDFQAQVHRIATVLPVILLLMVGLLVGFVAVKSMMGILAPLTEI